MPSNILPEKLTKQILKEADNILPGAWKLASAIFAKPELAFNEKFASSSLQNYLEDFGYKIEKGVGGLETAFTATLKGQRARPCLGILAEMDALPQIGHACGHHLIAAGSAGTAAVLANVLSPLPGSIKVIGCPAEEHEGGKIILEREGVFKGLDAALIVHPDKRTTVFKRSLGVVTIEFTFKGKSAHAAAEPETGINALDAVIQTFNSINALRQQLPEHVRVHGIVTDGGVAANIIPEMARAEFMARGLTIKETLDVADKVISCARGAAKSSGATVKIKMDKDQMYAPYVPNRALGNIFRQALDVLGIKEDIEPEDKGMGSTDVGNAGLAVPVIHPLLRVHGVDEGVHTRKFAKAASGKAGRDMLSSSIKATALTGAAVLLNKDLVKEIKAEHKATQKEMV